jgi:hypothetical protein
MTSAKMRVFIEIRVLAILRTNRRDKHDMRDEMMPRSIGNCSVKWLKEIGEI